MNVYTARQAILNVNQEVVAYELLFRDGEENCFPDIDPHEATGRLISRTQLNTGIKAITSGKPALINFTERCLLSEYSTMLSKKEVLIEILETVTPSDEVFEKCKKLHAEGYNLVLDDFVYRPEWKRFFPFIKIIKFDISTTPLPKIAKLVATLRKHTNIKMLAERVETQDEFELAKKMGFVYFQGFFFCKPEIRLEKDVDSDSVLLSKLYQEVFKDEMNIDAVITFFENDVGLTYKLLNYINGMGLANEKGVSSIRQAVTYLGKDKLQTLVSVLAIGVLGKDKPKEMIKIAIIRGRTCELAAKKVLPSMQKEAFLMGVLSMISSILDKPMEVVLSKLPVSKEIVAALTQPKSQTMLHIIYTAATLVEKGSWHLTTLECFKIGLHFDDFCKIHKDAIEWSQQFNVLIDQVTE